MNYIECIEKYVEEGYIGTNNTCNGKCTRCRRMLWNCITFR